MSGQSGFVWFAAAGLAWAIVLAPADAAAARDRKIAVGWTETVQIMPSGLLLQAKLDTGADNSSLNALNIRLFMRGDKRWVSFQIKNYAGETVDLERPVVRTARIKNLDGQSLRRPTIKLGICLGAVYRQVDVNLASREGFNFNMLIGRSFMEGRVVVDPAKIYVTKPSCPEVANR